MGKKLFCILAGSILLVSMIGVVLAHDSEYRSSEFFVESQGILTNLSYAPTSYDFGEVSQGQIRKTTFNIWNSGCCQLVAELSESCGWVTVNPTIAYSVGQMVPITVTINTIDLNVGPHHCDIRISSNGGEGEFQVDVYVIQPTEPMLYFYPQSLYFGDLLRESTAGDSFEIWNAGIGTLSYSFSEEYDWLGINPAGGSSTGEHDSILVSIDTSHLEYGLYSADVRISSNGGEGSLNVFFTVVETLEPVLMFEPKFYDFGEVLKGDVAQTFFEIWNSGGRDLHFYLSEQYDWVTVVPAEGLSAGEHLIVSVVINTSSVSTGHYTCSIMIDSNGGDDFYNFTVSVVAVINTAPTTPVVNGPKSAAQGEASEYNCVSTDPNGDQIYYNFSWGDGSFSSWRGPFDAGERCQVSHVWAGKGVFEVRVQAMDTNISSKKSNWSEPIMIGIDTCLYISVDEAWQLVNNISNGVQIPVDVRPANFFTAEHVDTQSSVETTRWFGETLFNKLFPLMFFKVFFGEKDVILYSQDGEQSARVAQVLVDNKFSGTVYNMVGGFDAWKAAGLPTISG